LPAATTKRFVCIHGHFYQPPRENPWLETIETQDSAAPYHDWNERICAECYATNGAARVVNKENQITRIVNNYARMSFNFGPTLLSWLAENAPRDLSHDSRRRAPQLRPL
jgi:alpha-amylase/alpha-mannosidase (GH57 family)